MKYHVKYDVDPVKQMIALYKSTRDPLLWTHIWVNGLGVLGSGGEGLGVGNLLTRMPFCGWQWDQSLEHWVFSEQAFLRQRF